MALTLEDFLERNRISEDDWKKADIPYDELLKIESDYRLQISHLNGSAEFLAKVLQKCPEVHSVRWRVKDPDHVLEKIVRKKSSGSAKYNSISVDNYSELITDLVGVRVLHLFKHEWMEIHNYIQESWTPIENVVAYIREGDEGGIVDSYKENGCNVEVHPAGYRSIHYIISMQPTLKKVVSEIQVRTIFEEGWSEIDHRVRYPNFMDNRLVSYFLTIFNRLSGSADEMGTFVNDLISDIKLRELQLAIKKKEQEEHLQKIESLAQELSDERSANQTKEYNLQKLKAEIESIRKNSTQMPDFSFPILELEEMGRMTSLSREALKFADIAKINTAQIEALKLSDMEKFATAYNDALKLTSINSAKAIVDAAKIYDALVGKTINNDSDDRNES